MNDTRSRQILPARAYTGLEWFERERDQLFGRVWAFACMEEDVSAPGDYVCVEAGRFAIIVVRDREGGLHALHNVCRHRGTRLLEGAGRLKEEIVCPHHGWAYALSGALASVPRAKHEFPGLDLLPLGLKRAVAAEWLGMVFVHPNPDTGPLEDWLAGLPQMHGARDPRRLAEAGRMTYRVRANWKLVVENFIDLYAGDHMRRGAPGAAGTWKPEGRHWTCRTPPAEGGRNESSLPPALSGTGEAAGAGTFLVFPNLVVCHNATTWISFHILPRDAGETLVEARIRAEGAGTSKPADLSPGLTQEDIHTCEAVHAGMLSPAFVAGPLSKSESALVFFQQNLASFLNAGSAAQAPAQAQEVAPGVAVVHGGEFDSGGGGEEVAPGITVTRLGGGEEGPAD